MKKILILGASYLQTFIIKIAKDNGYFVIALDGNKDSVGFKYADKFYVVSTIDLNAVMDIAKKEKIDGIMTYASDVSAPVVSRVANALKLPGNPCESVEIMTDKHKTRLFMEQNGFNVPKSYEVSLLDECYAVVKSIGLPVIMKPTDSSGSKGVVKLDSFDGLEEHFRFSMSFSRAKKLVIEEFIEREEYQIDADCFMFDGKMQFFHPMDQHHDPLAPFSPAGISAPSVQSKAKTQLAYSEVSRFLALLNMRFGEFNVEYIFDKKGKLYILEIGPRAGGNLIPDVIRYSYGIDLPLLTLKASLGETIPPLKVSTLVKNSTSFIIHSQKNGVFKGLQIDERIKNNIVLMDLFIKVGDSVRRFSGSADVIGFALISFDDIYLMKRFMDNPSSFFKVVIV